MKVDIVDQLNLDNKIRYICNRQEEVINMFKSYIGEIDEKYNMDVTVYIEGQYYKIKYLGKKKKCTTRNAILLAQKIKDEFDIICYPLISICSGRGTMDTGRWSWSMSEIKTGNDAGSSFSVKKCLQKSMKLHLYDSGFNCTEYDIFAEKINITRK